MTNKTRLRKHRQRMAQASKNAYLHTQTVHLTPDVVFSQPETHQDGPFTLAGLEGMSLNALRHLAVEKHLRPDDKRPALCTKPVLVHALLADQSG